MSIVTERYDNEFEQPREALQDNVIGCRLRLTAVTNADDALLRVIDDLVIDLPADGAGDALDRALAEYGVDLDRLRRNLRIAVSAARGAPEKLPRELFDSAAERPALIRAGERLGLL